MNIIRISLYIFTINCLTASYVKRDMLNKDVIISPTGSKNIRLSLYTSTLFARDSEELVVLIPQTGNRLKITSKNHNMCWDPQTSIAYSCLSDNQKHHSIWRILRIDDNGTYIIFLKELYSKSLNDNLCLTIDEKNNGNLEKCDLGNMSQRFDISEPKKEKFKLLVSQFGESYPINIQASEYDQSSEELSESEDSDNQLNPRNQKKCEPLLRDIQLITKPFADFPTEIFRTFSDLQKYIKYQSECSAEIPKELNVKGLSKIIDQLADDAKKKLSKDSQYRKNGCLNTTEKQKLKKPSPLKKIAEKIEQLLSLKRKICKK